jgi:hypothetical protein
MAVSEISECINNYVVVSTDYETSIRPHYCNPLSQDPSTESPKAMSEGHSTETHLKLIRE